MEGGSCLRSSSPILLLVISSKKFYTIVILYVSGNKCFCIMELSLFLFHFLSSNLRQGMFPFAWKMKVGDLGDLKSRIWLIYSLIWEQRFSFSQIDLTSIRPGRLLPSSDCKENHSAKIYDSAESLIILWALTLPWIIELGISRMLRIKKEWTLVILVILGTLTLSVYSLLLTVSVL